MKQISVDLIKLGMLNQQLDATCDGLIVVIEKAMSALATAEPQMALDVIAALQEQSEPLKAHAKEREDKMKVLAANEYLGDD